MPKIILKRAFFEKDTIQVAKNILGCFLVRKKGRKTIRARITEVEAYIGEDDLACHASKGRTARTETMYGEAGHAYIYLIYGMYHCLNIVTEKKDFPAAVLIRAVEIEGVPKEKTNGPGKVSRELGIDRSLNGWDVTKGERLWLEPGQPLNHETIRAMKRVGIDYAKHCRHYLWRFVFHSTPNESVLRNG